MPYLAFNLNDGNEFVFDVLEDRLSIGRDSANDIVIDNHFISGFHAEFVRQDDGNYDLVDLGSANGCFVNGRRIKRARVKGGDRIQFGQLEARFRERAPKGLAPSKQPQAKQRGANPVTKQTDPETAASAVNDWDVFVCAASEDGADALEVVEFLQAAGVRCFYSGSIPGGRPSSSFKTTIDQALDVCQHMVVVYSSLANVKKRWVEYEWSSFINDKLAGRKRGNLISLACGRVDAIDLPLYLRQNQVLLWPEENDHLLAFLPGLRLERGNKQLKSPAAPQRQEQARSVSGARLATNRNIFISAASEDYPHAQKVYEFFVGKGFNVFFAGKSLRNAEYSRMIQQAILNSLHMFVVASSENYLNKRWVEEEWTTFHDYMMSGKKEGGQLVTIWCGSGVPGDLPPFLSRREIFKPSELARLLEYVRPPSAI